MQKNIGICFHEIETNLKLRFQICFDFVKTDSDVLLLASAFAFAVDVAVDGACACACACAFVVAVACAGAFLFFVLLPLFFVAFAFVAHLSDAEPLLGIGGAWLFFASPI